MKYKILIVEDGKEDATHLTNACHQGGYQTSLADSGEKALEMVWTWKPDMLLLDLTLPGIGGKEVCRILREDERGRAIPVLMVTQAKERADILNGFAAGADDYLIKPIEPQELVARMNAVLRRYHKKSGESEVLQVGKVMLDFSKHRVEVDGQPVKLTGKEFGLLEVLMKKSGRVLSRQFLLEYVWGYEEEVLTRTIDMHIARLRQKLGDEGRERIQTVERFGYRFSDE
ncbi:MAG: response regulator transcription factor [Elusimicrobiota bacterium]|jgi:DNA-binding response OmpR family regulator